MKLDVLAFGVHPDDVELGCSGSLLSLMHQGKTAGIVDLTLGELGTRGTADTRRTEAAAAANAMRIAVRENLEMADGFFLHDETNVRKIITVLRKYRPEIVFCTAPHDRHPDHGRSSKLIEDAAFLSGLMKIETTFNNEAQEAWRPKYVFNYIQDRYIEPDFVMDISDFMDKKLEAVLCYRTQFYADGNKGPQTYISTPQFFESIKARALQFGKTIGTQYGEGFLSKKTLGFKNLDSLILATT